MEGKLTRGLKENTEIVEELEENLLRQMNDFKNKSEELTQRIKETEKLYSTKKAFSAPHGTTTIISDKPKNTKTSKYELNFEKYFKNDPFTYKNFFEEHPNIIN